MLGKLALALAALPLVPLLTACQPIQPEAGAPPAAEVAAPDTPAPEAPSQAEPFEPDGFIRNVHDPAIAREGDAYYLFSTGSHIIILCSPDMRVWDFCARVFAANPPWTRDVNPNLVDIWAPDISFFTGRWHLYYAVSTFGTQDSAIGLATNATLDPDSPDYAWEDQGVVLRSQPGDAWNAIDPALVLDENGEPWLAWGSFWTGIWMQKVDPATGMLDPSTDPVQLADRSTGPDNTTAIEAPFIVRRNGWWYLFVSFDQCCQGAASTYHVRVGRSDALTGPYVDRAGVPLTAGGGSAVLAAYDKWKGPGHNSVLIEDGVYWMVYHAYDAQQNGIPKLRIEPIVWDAEGWPTLPSQTE